MTAKTMWFGTRHHSEWVKVPLAGADMSPQSWSAEGTLLTGGGYAFNSRDSHREYVFEWSAASSRDDAERIQRYRDGVYSVSSRDLIYFIDPLIQNRNILPRRWAQPGILSDTDRTQNSPLGKVFPEVTSGGALADDVPIMGVSVESRSLADFNNLTAPRTGAVWVPVPEGQTVTLLAWTGSDAGSNGLYVRALKPDNTWESTQKAGSTPLTISNVKGFLLGTVGTFNFFGARAYIGSPDHPGKWLPGMGNSGCEFVGNPTWVANTGVGGGQIGFATTLREVGDWQ